MNTFDLYKDIETRTGGEIYIGVVGPVRTGKSTFIKRFMDVLVLPGMKDEHMRARTLDELPQSASGKTIMTTEPKFVPKEAAVVRLSGDTDVKVRLIDCVGYMVEGAAGHIENGDERQVKTPWFEYEIPFTKAAGIGTRKVICDHSTIGIVITTDGSIGDIPRENYRPAEEQTIQELKSLGKPFIVLVNTRKPYSEEPTKVAKEIEETHKVTAMPVNCEQLKEEDIHHIMEQILFAFPVSEIQFFIPKWVEMLPRDHKIKQDMLEYVRQVLNHVDEIRDAQDAVVTPQSPYITEAKVGKISMDTGCVAVEIRVDDAYYYETLSELTGTAITSEYDLIGTIKELSSLRKEYESVKDAMDSVKLKGYGVVSPGKEEIHLDEPVVIKQGNKFGVKIHSEAPSIHMIRANIETEIAPIVGSEQQAEDLKNYIKAAAQSPEGVWGTNIFGKSIEELVMDGMHGKIAMINDESQVKLQDTMQKIVNDSNGGLVCIII
ncbi:stage IV sporulation protein A [bacterium]|nr:stage IV sporulation protein A [bacterium]MDY2885073.1 stage IV sporulation protein A [Bariatricus sp.]